MIAKSFFFNLELPLGRSSLNLVPQIERILVAYYQRLYPEHQQIEAAVKKISDDRKEKIAILHAMDYPAYQSRLTAVNLGESGQHQSDEEMKNEKKEVEAILKYDPFSHLTRLMPQQRTINNAWCKYLESRLNNKHKLREHGYTKEKSNAIVDDNGFKYFPDKMAKSGYGSKANYRTDQSEPRPSKDIKNRLNKLQKGVCFGCLDTFPQKALVLDHIIATKKGGQDTNSNLQLLCNSCNSIKGNRSMRHLLIRLKAIKIQSAS